MNAINTTTNPLTTGCNISNIQAASSRMAGVLIRGMSNERLDLIIGFAAYSRQTRR
jgi:hypothetical protein